MANHYFFTLLSLILVCIVSAALGIWQHIPLINSPTRYTLALSILLWVLLHGFIHAVKADNDAKFFSYLCGTLSLIFTLMVTVITFVVAPTSSLVFVGCVLSYVIAAVSLILTTRKKTRSYF